MTEATKAELVDIIFNSPLTLLTIRDREALEFIHSLLPYSTAMEIECHQKPDFNVASFKGIPNIMSVSVDSGEQRFRIPQGITGMLCLYFICLRLDIESELNPGSGIHYHVDMTDVDLRAVDQVFKDKWSDQVLTELDSWGYTGNYNRRAIGIRGNWVAIPSRHFTAEFRCGEMTFDYKAILTCMMSANKIVSWFKSDLPKVSEYPVILEVEKRDDILVYIASGGVLAIDKETERYKEKLLLLELEMRKKEASKPVKPEVDMKKVIKSRVQTI